MLASYGPSSSTSAMHALDQSPLPELSLICLITLDGILASAIFCLLKSFALSGSLGRPRLDYILSVSHFILANVSHRSTFFTLLLFVQFWNLNTFVFFLRLGYQPHPYTVYFHVMAFYLRSCISGTSHCRLGTPSL